MGVIRRESIEGMLVTYGGVALGALNTLLLYPRFFSTEEIGLMRVLFSLSMIFTTFGCLGANNIFTRYFPALQTPDRRHHDLVNFTVTLASFGLLLMLVAYLVFDTWVQGLFDDSPLFVEYYLPGALLCVLVSYVHMLDSLLTAVYRTVFSTFVREFLIRFLAILGIGAFHLDWLSFSDFIWLQIGIHLMAVLLLVGQFHLTREFSWGFSLARLPRQRLGSMLQFGLLTVLTGSALFLAQSIDNFMLASMVGLESVGIYSTFFFMGTFLSIPGRSMTRIVRAVIATAWTANDRDTVRQLCHRVTLVLLNVGLLMYIGVGINGQHVQRFLPPEFQGYFAVFWLVGMAFLVDMVLIPVRLVQIQSSSYAWDVFINGFMLVLAAFFNYILIQQMGTVGAALATCITMIVTSLIRWYVSVRLHAIQPFGRQHGLTLLVTGLALAAGWGLPTLPLWWLDLGARSALTGGLFLGLGYWWNVCPDINQRLEVYTRIALRVTRIRK
jgi:O-antigen/teichoic acid export membrane protein